MRLFRRHVPSRDPGKCMEKKNISHDRKMGNDSAEEYIEKREVRKRRRLGTDVVEGS
jgi:hypothetical protein